MKRLDQPQIFNRTVLKTNTMKNIYPKLKKLALLLPALYCIACMPSLTYEGRTTQILDAREAIKCKHIGNNRITLHSSFSNNPTKQTQALLIEARNLAAKIGADTVVAVGQVENKQQVFKFYICDSDH